MSQAVLKRRALIKGRCRKLEAGTVCERFTWKS